MIGLHNGIMQIPAGFEILIVIIIIVVLFFGVKKIPELARSFGKATTEYEKAKVQAERELDQIRGSVKSGRAKLEEVAHSLRIDYSNKNDDDLRKDIEGALNKGKKS
jgi:sec-independent protein translocase protein TatA